MSEPTPRPLSLLNIAVQEKFRRAFGPPHRSEGKDSHWGLRRLGYIASINVLINGSVDQPVVWVFDPHDAADGVTSTKIIHESQMDDLIKRIEERVKNAGQGGYMRH